MPCNARLISSQPGIFASIEKIILFSIQICCQKRGKPRLIMREGTTTQSPAFADAKGGEKMKPLSHEEQERVQKQFDSFCKKILKYAACDYYRALNYRKKHEVAFSALSEQELAKFSVTDEYFKDAHSFTVQDFDIADRTSY